MYLFGIDPNKTPRTDVLVKECESKDILAPSHYYRAVKLCRTLERELNEMTNRYQEVCERS